MSPRVCPHCHNTGTRVVTKNGRDYGVPCVHDFDKSALWGTVPGIAIVKGRAKGGNSFRKGNRWHTKN